MPAILILVLLAGAIGGASAQRNTKTGATRYSWGAVNLAVRPDSISGVRFWLVPDPLKASNETRTFSASFSPEAVATWAAAVDSLIARMRTKAPDAPPALIESVRGSFISVYRRRGTDKDPITIQFRAPKAAPLVLEAGEKGAKLLRDALLNAVSRSAFRPELMPETNPVDEMTIDSASAPERISGPPPRYPTLLRNRGVQGSVLVEFVIDTTGIAEKGTVDVIWADHDDFASAALRAIEQTIYKPGRLNGEPVRVLVRQPVVFGISRQ